MSSSPSTPSKEEIELSYRISTIIACDIAAEYATGLATIYNERKSNYERNKSIEAAAACHKAIQVISRDLQTVMPHTKDHVERIMSVIYEVVGLPLEKQELVHNFITKLKEDTL